MVSLKIDSKDYFIIKDHTGFRKVVTLSDKTKDDDVIRVNKLTIPVKFLRERGEYGVTYCCFRGDEWCAVDCKESLLRESLEEFPLADAAVDSDQIKSTTSDSSRENDVEVMDCDQVENRDESGGGQVQLLGNAEITRMKYQGFSPSRIIRALIRNSETFQKKTHFSQEKYIKKKKAKYWKEFVCLPVSTMDILETHWGRDFKRIGGLRFDYLSGMLTLGNVNPGATVLVIDQCLGLLTGAVLKRMCGQGKLLRVSGKGLTSSLLKELNLSSAEETILVDVPLPMVIRLMEKEEPLDELLLDEESQKDVCRSVLTKRSCCGIVENDSSRDLLMNLLIQPLDTILVAVSPLGRAMEISASQMFSLTLKIAEQLLCPGGRLIIFSLSHTHLIDISQHLHLSKDYIDISFQELFLREYTVLSHRTHPLMQNESRLFCGFLLSCIKILNV